MEGSGSESFTSRSVNPKLIPYAPEEEMTVRLALRRYREEARARQWSDSFRRESIAFDQMALGMSWLPQRRRWPAGLGCGGFGERCATPGMDDGGAAELAFGGWFGAAIASGEVVRASVVIREETSASGCPAVALCRCRPRRRLPGQSTASHRTPCSGRSSS
ncbi:unnamed protein product [Triticum turgidum subsp. durum]|uniref:Uncharacterized protein n=1 Tax=Triticum turgidum subsp. durum TaxID=4567 RepID=A0A9R1RE74_TRITD|nr:unnamed protein product [Triticum turgidum subsp. durum]